MKPSACHVSLLSHDESKATRRCRYCRGPLAGVGTWCGRECVDLWFVATGDVRTIRRLLLRRDLGRCALCRLDTGLLARTLSRLMEFVGFHLPWAAALAVREVLVWIGWTEAKAAYAVGLYDTSVRQSSLWEADHVVPKARGGINDLSNLRSLCVPCHATETLRVLGVGLRAAGEARCGRVAPSRSGGAA